AFSHLDAEHWTDELKTELNFDQSTALNHDDGIFWIDYESVCSTFNSIHINWNLENLKHRAVIHAYVFNDVRIFEFDLLLYVRICICVFLALSIYPPF